MDTIINIIFAILQFVIPVYAPLWATIIIICTILLLIVINYIFKQYPIIRSVISTICIIIIGLFIFYLNKPPDNHLRIILADTLYAEQENKTFGPIIYDFIITLPTSEQYRIEDLLITIKFRFFLNTSSIGKKVGTEGGSITIGTGNNISNIEISAIKPGGIIEFQILSEFFDRHMAEEPIEYSGYYYIEVNGRKLKVPFKGLLHPKPMNVTQAETQEVNVLREICKNFYFLDSNGGALFGLISNIDRPIKDHQYIELIPQLENGDMKLHVFKDSDNTLNCVIRTHWFKESTLSFRNLESLIGKHPRHMITICWSKEEISFDFDKYTVHQQQETHR